LVVLIMLEYAPVAAEQHTIPEASTALPGTAAAETQNTEPSSPPSPASPVVPADSGNSGNPSPDHPFKSLIRSFTEPTTGKPTDGTGPTSVDPKTGVAQVYPYILIFSHVDFLAAREFHAKREFRISGATSQGKDA
jgi:hypothetical protein